MTFEPFKSKLIADLGISMGDEGKGRVVCEIIEELRDDGCAPVEVVIKLNGGANSGHTAAGLKFNLLPSAVGDAAVPILAIGSGVVGDPRKFLWEALPLEKMGHNVLGRLVIDERAMVSDLSHRLLDLAWEDYRCKVLGMPARGSTGRGISPAFSDEAGQWQIFYHSFRGEKDEFARLMSERADRATRVIQHVCRVSEETWDSFFDTLTTAEEKANSTAIEAGVFPASEFDFHLFKGVAPFQLNVDHLIDVYWEAGHELASNVGDVRQIVLETSESGKTVIGEFGQSYWLDKRHGFSPNVTASHTTTPEFFLSAGIPPQPVHVIGTCKAYDTKVGTHVFHTEIPDENPLALKLKQLEFGTSTGRQRMVGWFDAVEKGTAMRYCGFDDLVINKIDALTHSDGWKGELSICTAYEDRSGNRVHRVPRDDRERRSMKPVYKQIPGWIEDISLCRSFFELPSQARNYVAWMVKSTLDAAQCPGPQPRIRYLGVGPDPKQIIKDVPASEQLIKENLLDT
jgi:adenylosuccinate synthase